LANQAMLAIQLAREVDPIVWTKKRRI